MTRTVFSLGDETVVNNSRKESIQTTINVTLTINVLRANVDDLTIFFAVLEVSNSEIFTAVITKFFLGASFDIPLLRHFGHITIH
jgi:energy-converting hydrogenase Eha subunit H